MVTRRSERVSGMEALRMLSMFMVLVLHADYAALGLPEAREAADSAWSVVARIGFEQLSLVAVNSFVLISGWFGIRTTLCGVASLCFQVVWCAAVALAVAAIFFTVGDVRTALTPFIPGYCHWFIRSYLGLMILAPVLNAFCERATVRQLAAVTAAFFLFEVIYGWVIGSDGFARGYSVLSFIGLYLLGRLASAGQWNRFGAARWVTLYLACSAVATAASEIFLMTSGSIPDALNAYDSPLCIGGALGLTMAFACGRWRSKWVNACAASVLAVYLLHFNPLLFSHYLGVCRDLFAAYDGIAAGVMIGLFLLGVFAASLIADLPRRLLWKRLSRL